MIRVGLGVGGGSCRAVLLRGRTLLWQSEEPRRGEEAPGEMLHRLLARAPLRSVLRPHVMVAIGPPFVQLRRITSLPAIAADARRSSTVVRNSPERFFPTAGTSVLIPDLTNHGERPWGAAFDADLVATVAAACRQVRLRLDGCVPSAWAMAASRADGHYQWSDGEVVLDLEIGGGALERVHRWRGARQGSAVQHSVDSANIVHLPRFADALSAVGTRRNAPLIVLGRAGHPYRPRMRVALRLAASAACVAWIGAPAFAASRARQHAERRLATLRSMAGPAARAAHDLRVVTIALDAIGRFANSRRSMLLVLGELVRMFPDSTTIATLRVDSAGGSLVALAPSAARVLSQLHTTTIDVQVAGAITPAIVDGTALQRLPLRFRFSTENPTR